MIRTKVKFHFRNRGMMNYQGYDNYFPVLEITTENIASLKKQINGLIKEISTQGIEYSTYEIIGLD